MIVQTQPSIEYIQPQQSHWPKLGIYRHYKDKLYRVIGVCRHTETLEELVFYQSLYGDYEFWARPVSMFCSDIEIDGKMMPRFTFVREQ
jgi:hypothetical protein